jgi:hypothetical protein
MAAVSLSTPALDAAALPARRDRVVLITRFNQGPNGRTGSALRWHDDKRVVEVDVVGRAAKLLVQLASVRLALPERG